jgi:Ca2+-binding RTX toxin-like protein
LRDARLRTSLIAAALSVGALALPAAANAADPAPINGTTGNDTIILTVENGNYHYILNGTDTDTTTAFTANANVTVDGLAGNDVIDATELPAADYGKLTIHGSDGDDTITGGQGADTIFGDAGNDRIAGFKGADTMSGGAGDDTLIWNNGDANDVTNGDDGFDVTEVNTGAANDAMTVKPNGTRTMFARVAVPAGPPAFTMDMDTEALRVNSFGGDDTLTVDQGVTQSIVADAGAGNDTFTGGDESDTFFGGAGDDKLTGGNGADALLGQDGNDALFARDDSADVVDGGAGTDSAQVDVRDAVANVEAVDAPSVQPPPAPDVKAYPATVTASSVKLVRVRGHLVAKVPLQSAKAVKLGHLKLLVVLGSKTVTLKGGTSGFATITLASGSEVVVHHGAIAASAWVVTTDAAGNVATSARSLKLTLPHAAKPKSKKK